MIVVIVILGSQVFGQNDNEEKKENSDNEEIKTIFKTPSAKSFGFYIAFSAQYSSLKDDMDAYLIGGRLSCILNHNVGIGIGGYGFVNDMKYNDVDGAEDYYLVGGYGGLYIEPILFPKSPIHISFPILIGAGGVSYEEAIDNGDDWWDDDKWDDWEDRETVDSEGFFVIEPGVEIEFNMMKNLRLAVGASYRKTVGIDLINSDSDIIDGFNAGLTFKIGKF